jgi:tripartite-type tricarboxylate transporter receptor subunit TctC
MRFAAKLLITAVLLCAQASLAPAQQYPSRTVQIYVGTTAGGAVDVIARALAEDFGNALGASFIVINKEGRNNTIAATQVARSNLDGYTLGFNAAGPFVSDLHTREGIPFKLSQIDFICQLL